MKQKKHLLLSLKKETISNLNLYKIKGGTQVISAPTGRELACTTSQKTKESCNCPTNNCSQECSSGQINKDFTLAYES